MLLVGDIGGTKTDLALYSLRLGTRTPVGRAELPSRAYPSLKAMVSEFLGKVAVNVDAACFAVAGPVIGGAARTTNLPWLIEADEVAAELGIPSVHLLNDLEAMAYAVPLLQPQDVHPLAVGAPVKGGSIAIIAPGTGLGEAFLTWHGAGYVAHASEGGHADFAPTDEQQIELLRYLKQRIGHVSYESVCSGIGVPNVYDFLRESGAAAEPPEVTERIAKAPDRTRTILQIAMDVPEASPRCAATLKILCSVLGSEAGNLALKVLATAGVYLAGGVATHIVPALINGPFLSAFRDKGRLSDLLAQVPIHVIMSPAALIGAAAYGLRLLEPETSGTKSKDLLR